MKHLDKLRMEHRQVALQIGYFSEVLMVDDLAIERLKLADRLGQSIECTPKTWITAAVLEFDTQPVREAFRKPGP